MRVPELGAPRGERGARRLHVGLRCAPSVALERGGEALQLVRRHRRAEAQPAGVARREGPRG